jgi:L-ribulose-5-phosphate 3-epimerase
MSMRIGYNTNGLAHHDLIEAIDLLAELGYQSVALTIDHGALSPYQANWQRQAATVREALARHGMHSVIETGARYLLDPRVKHEPTLLTADESRRQMRIGFLRHAVRLAEELGSDCVSLWSGVLRDNADDATAWTRLTDGLQGLLDFAAVHHVVVGFEPEPGMFIDTMDKFTELSERLPHSQLQLTLDLGHLHCQGETPIAEQIRRWGPRIVNIHIEDMRADAHEHLMFGEGEIEFPPVFAALREIGYQKGVHVELSRHSHDGPAAAKRALEFLSKL